MRNVLARFLKDEAGATAIEYGLISRRDFRCNYRCGDNAWKQPEYDV
jgi:hypothetical protein